MWNKILITPEHPNRQEVAKRGFWRTHHFLMIWVVNLLNQWELLGAQLLVESWHLSKLGENLTLRCYSNCLYILNMFAVEWTEFSKTTYHPWFVAEVIDRVQGVNTWQSSVLQSDHHVAMVPIPVHTESVLSDEHKVWPKGSGTGDIREI